MKNLGICWIVYGILRVCIGVAQIFFAPTATVMFGALLVRVPEPYSLMGWFHVMYAVFIVISIACGILGFVGGLAMMGNARNGRTMLVIAALLALSEIPIGIALGVYTLVTLIPARSSDFPPRGRD